jgi:hypothetical protein
VGYLSTLGAALLSAPGSTLRNAEFWFPLFYLPLYETLPIDRPVGILLVNVVLWFGTALLVRELVSWKFGSNRHYSPNLLFVLLLVSPSAIYWTGTFNKEITSTFLCVLAAYLFLRDRYLLFGAVLLVATGIRPYSVAIIYVYVAVFRRDFRLLVLGALGSLAVVLIATSSLVPLLNSILVTGFLFVSPNPFEVANWLDPFVFFRTVEGVLVGVVSVFAGILFLTKREYTREMLLVGLGAFIYGLVLTLVGYHVTVGDGEPYTLLTIGDTVLRKKMPLLPLVGLWTAYGIELLRTEVVSADVNIGSRKSTAEGSGTGSS